MSTQTSVSVQSSASQSDDRKPEIDTRPGDDLAPLAWDEVFHLLQNQRRRLVLRYLTTHAAAVEMRDVAEQVAAWENDTSVAELTSDARQRVYIALYQSHLPKLDENGVIEYDRNRGTIEPCAALAQLEQYLPDSPPMTEGDDTDNTGDTDDTDNTGDVADEDETERLWQWNDYYLGLAVLSVLSVLAMALYVPSSGPGFWLSAIIAGTLGVSTLIQRFRDE